MGDEQKKQKVAPPWDRRPWPSKGDADQDALYSAVGRALSEWERYESSLAFLYANFLGNPYFLIAMKSYGAVRTFEGRAEMLKAASSAFFFGSPNIELQQKFKVILTNSKEFSLRRNDLAHGVVDYFRPQPPAYSTLGDLGAFALFPAFATFKERTLEGDPLYCYTAAELEYFRSEFQKLREPAHRLSAEIAGFSQSLLQKLRTPIP